MIRLDTVQPEETHPIFGLQFLECRKLQKYLTKVQVKALQTISDKSQNFPSFLLLSYLFFFFKHTFIYNSDFILFLTHQFISIFSEFFISFTFRLRKHLRHMSGLSLAYDVKKFNFKIWMNKFAIWEKNVQYTDCWEFLIKIILWYFFIHSALV